MRTRLALASLRQHPLRTLLAILGVAVSAAMLLDMVMLATQVARRETFAQPGENVVIVAGLPFGRTGSTNLLHVARVDDVTI